MSGLRLPLMCYIIATLMHCHFHMPALPSRTDFGHGKPRYASRRMTESAQFVSFVVTMRSPYLLSLVQCIFQQCKLNRRHYNNVTCAYKGTTSCNCLLPQI